ncbi:MAG TPA: hypothetical protein VFC46_06740 [Humisphaera sp.]|nr:hypothetical protein [Humisphaera sp.]
MKHRLWNFLGDQMCRTTWGRFFVRAHSNRVRAPKLIAVALIALIASGCSSTNTMIDAGLAFRNGLRADKIKGVKADAHMQIRDYEVATSSGGLRSVIVRVWDDPNGPETKFVLVQMPGEIEWRLMSSKQVLNGRDAR